jgi:RimJ/RimL family protein N-acetyltransferase
MVMPGYFRFPFMGRRDIQIGDTWTAEEERGRGLAREALRFALSRLPLQGGRVWYVTRADNAASVAVAQSAGLRLVGRGCKFPRMGVHLFGYYGIVESMPEMVE